MHPHQQPHQQRPPKRVADMTPSDLTRTVANAVFIGVFAAVLIVGALGFLMSILLGL